MRFRKLRIAFSATCAIACVLLIVLWVRSYSRRDDMFGPLSAAQWYDIEHVRGRVMLGISLRDLGRGITSTRLPIPGEPGIVQWPESPLGFGILQFPSGSGLIVPYWFLVSLSTAITAIPWITWPKRFSLRTHLIATTLLAVVLGLFVAVLRRPAG
jgi:hypothetical protein